MSLKARWQSIRSFGTSFLWRFRWSVSRVRGGNSVMLWGLCHNDLEVCFGIHLGLWGMTLVIRFSHTFLNYLTPCNISLSTYANQSGSCCLQQRILKIHKTTPAVREAREESSWHFQALAVEKKAQGNGCYVENQKIPAKGKCGHRQVCKETRLGECFFWYMRFLGEYQNI